MEITGLNKHYNPKTYSSGKAINMAEAFKSEVTNWQEKIKEKNNEALENDRERNIKMSEKHWKALLNKVDNAIQAVKPNNIEMPHDEMLSFPPTDAPDSVKQAWDEGTKGLTSDEKMDIFIKLMAKQIEKNYYIDANGKAVERKPGEAELKNALGNSEESYIAFFNSIIERIDSPLGMRDNKHIKEDELAKKVLLNVISLIKK
jgi:hypothetical protein